MKLMGIVFIFVSISAAGAAVGESYISVLKSIKRAENFLDLLITGLENGRISVPEMLKNASAFGDHETVAFIDVLESHIETGGLFAEAKTALESGFCKDETTTFELTEAINILGKCSAEEQIERIKYCRENIRKRHEEATMIYGQKAKLSRSSGVLAGLLAAVILI